MKLTIFGSTGNIGKKLVQQALELGHEVRAFSRNPQRPDKTHENLTLVKGDVLDPSSVQRAIEGVNAVICALGASVMDKSGLRAKGTKNIVKAMEKTGVKRLVCLSALGVGDSRALLPFSYKFLIIPLVMRHLFADHAAQESHVRKSALDWVIVRPGNFTKGARTGTYRFGFTADDEAPKLKISHDDVADFMLTQLEDDTWLHKAPCISW